MATAQFDPPLDQLDIISNTSYAEHGYPHDAWARLRRESPVHWFDQLMSYLLYGFNLLLLIGCVLLFLGALRLLKLGHGRHWKLGVAGCACILLSQFLGWLTYGASIGLGYLSTSNPAWVMRRRK